VYIKSALDRTEIWYDVEMTVTVLSHPVPNTCVVGNYRSKTVRISQLIEALTHLHESVLAEPTIAINRSSFKNVLSHFKMYLIF